MCNLLIYGFLFSLVVEEGLSITCYTCNSRYVKSCENLKALPDEERAKFATDCHLIKAAHVTNFTMCRKINQKVEDETRVIRQCASGGNDGECLTRTGTKKIKMEYCECTKDLCNSGRSHHTNGINILGVIVTISLLLTLSPV